MKLFTRVKVPITSVARYNKTAPFADVTKATDKVRLQAYYIRRNRHLAKYNAKITMRKTW